MRFRKFLLLPVVLTGLLLAAAPAALADDEGGQAKEEHGEQHLLIVPYDYDPWYYDPLWWGPLGYGPAYYPYYPPQTLVRVVPKGMVPVELEVHPKRATVVLDGNNLGQARGFDSEFHPLWLKPGKHLLTLSSPGYETLTVQLDTTKAVHSELHYRLQRGNGTDPRSVPAENQARVPTPAENPAG